MKGAGVLFFYGMEKRREYPRTARKKGNLRNLFLYGMGKRREYPRADMNEGESAKIFSIEEKKDRYTQLAFDFREM